MNLDQKTKQVRRKRNNFDSVNALYEDRELTLNAFKSEIFLVKKHKKMIENNNS